jgi:hypothetical protein
MRVNEVLRVKGGFAQRVVKTSLTLRVSVVSHEILLEA